MEQSLAFHADLSFGELQHGNELQGVKTLMANVPLTLLLKTIALDVDTRNV